MTLRMHALLWLALLWLAPQAVLAELRLQLLDANGAPAPDVVVLAPDVGGPPIAGKVSIDQRDMQFVPHVVVAPLGQLVHFPNSDKTRHQVYSFSAPNNFELKLYRREDAPPVSFNHEGVVELGCNIHDAMKGYIFVTQSTSFGVTDETGWVTLRGVEKLPVNLQLWHPVMATSAPQKRLLRNDHPLKLDFAIPEKPKASNSSLRDRLQQFKGRND